MAHYTLKWFNKLAENLHDYEIFTRVKESFNSLCVFPAVVAKTVAPRTYYIVILIII